MKRIGRSLFFLTMFTMWAMSFFLAIAEMTGKAAYGDDGRDTASGVGVVLGSDCWPDIGVFWPIIVAAAVVILVCNVIGPPRATSGCWPRSATSSWQLW